MLVPWFGIYGAAWATLAAYATRFLWIYHFAQRYYPIRYDWKNIAKLYGILGAAVALRFAYNPGHLPASIGWSMGLLLTSLGLVYTLVLSVGDRATLRSVVGGYFPGAMQRRAGKAG
jgi:O-antigen/teichoic acid export membrane protein